MLYLQQSTIKKYVFILFSLFSLNKTKLAKSAKQKRKILTATWRHYTSKKRDARSLLLWAKVITNFELDKMQPLHFEICTISQ